jgi:Zn-finger nucleic acid-binding protein
VLRPIDLHDLAALECEACEGLFLDRATIEHLAGPDGHELRLAFPRRTPRPDAGVKYLNCPMCTQPMNRTNFARVSGVIVDVCKSDGIWFDAGEVNAVVAFIESGAIERVRAKEAHDAENERLLAELRRVREETFAIGRDPTFRRHFLEMIGTDPRRRWE